MSECACWGCRSRRAAAAAVREVLRDVGVPVGEACRLSEAAGRAAEATLIADTESTEDVAAPASETIH